MKPITALILGAWIILQIYLCAVVLFWKITGIDVRFLLP